MTDTTPGPATDESVERPPQLEDRVFKYFPYGVALLVFSTSMYLLNPQAYENTAPITWNVPNVLGMAWGMAILLFAFMVLPQKINGAGSRE